MRKRKGPRLIETRREGSRQPLRDCEPYKRCISKQISSDYFLFDLFIFFYCRTFVQCRFSFLNLSRERKEVGGNAGLGRPDGLAFVEEVERDDEDSFEDTRPPGENPL